MEAHSATVRSKLSAANAQVRSGPPKLQHRLSNVPRDRPHVLPCTPAEEIETISGAAGNVSRRIRAYHLHCSSCAPATRMAALTQACKHFPPSVLKMMLVCSTLQTASITMLIARLEAHLDGKEHTMLVDSSSKGKKRKVLPSTRLREIVQVCRHS